MNTVFDEGLRKAVLAAGYKNAVRVDTVRHGDYIMNKALALVRLAPFIVADFTGNSYGVYYEAGFAEGLKKPVIHCCQKSEFKKVHFDTSQRPFLRWTEVGDLREQLRDEIMGRLGAGPLHGRQAAAANR